MGGVPGDLDVPALFAAVDSQRVAKDMSWAQGGPYEAVRVVLAMWAGFVTGVGAIAAVLLARDLVPDFNGLALFALPVWVSLGALWIRKRLPAAVWAVVAVTLSGLLVLRLVLVGHLVTM